MLDNGIRQQAQALAPRSAKRKVALRRHSLDGDVFGVPKTRPLQGGPHDAQWSLFMTASCGLQMSHESITVEPLLYDHPQNHIGVVV